MSLTLYLYDNCCSACGRKDQVYRGNVTHNLVPMADKACLYKSLWHPEDKGIKIASDLTPLLEMGLQSLLHYPGTYRLLNPSNGWGSYEGFVQFVSELLAACRAFPNATVEADT